MIHIFMRMLHHTQFGTKLVTFSLPIRKHINTDELSINNKSPLSNLSPSWTDRFPVSDGSTPEVPFHGNLGVVHSSSLKWPSDAELAQRMTLQIRYISESLIRLLEINVHIVIRYTQISTSYLTLP